MNTEIHILFLSLLLVALNLDVRSQTKDLILPPNEPAIITGQEIACVGENSTYFIDIPLSCITNWYINNTIQSYTGSAFNVVWDSAGVFNIEVYIICDTSNYSAGSITVNVYDIPSLPGVISGDSLVCVETISTYETTVQEGVSCIWLIDGLIQGSDSSSMTYYWTEEGEHIIGVLSENQCGLSDSRDLEVMVFDYPIVDLGNDTILNQGQTLLLDAGNPGSYFLWSTGETTQTILVSSPGTYGVTVTNPCGSAYDEIIVEYITQIEEIENKQLTIRNRLISFTDKIASFEICDLNGNVIFKSIANNSYRFHKSGVYFVKMKEINSDRITTEKVIVY
jgi:hypothetical protein